ncbi:MAG TPA: GNAT family N-acetyltransferase [Sandaracinaceae bacterium LLY-WYZ-13_1]|nr:GNAT family N-acetyltransferase [Sandaracinaceae bacterium LLY-WYZ-13_1]
MTPPAAFVPLAPSDGLAVRRFLYLAIFVPEGVDAPAPSIVDHPDLRKYWQGWGRRGDVGVGARRNGEWVGMAWTRLFTPDAPGYGYRSPLTPELSMAVAAKHRNQGIGSGLLKRLLEELRGQAVTAVSLSVDQRNVAVRLYERFGFRIVASPASDHVMERAL